MEGKRRNTKHIIMTESMKLFSINGYEAVSIRTIAEAVGIGNSALYKHYKSKQDILDAIVEYSKNYYLEVSEQHMQNINSFDSMKEACLAMFRFQTQDDWIVMFRKLLIIEQFKNPTLADIYQSFFITTPLESQQKMFEQLMEKGLMKRQDSYVLAMELYAPFYLFHTAYQEDDRILEKLKKHVELFWEEKMDLFKEFKK